jgi:hypothetical protein
MGRPRLTLAEIERRDRENKRYSTLTQRIKKLFSNSHVKTFLHYLKISFSNYFVTNVSNLVSRIIDNKNIDPFIDSDEEFKSKLTDEVTKPIEIVNVEDDTGPFPKIEQPEIKIEQTPQIQEQFENFEQIPQEKTNYEMMVREDRKNELR